MTIDQIVEYCRSLSDNNIKRYVEPSHVAALKDGVSRGLSGNDLSEFLLDSMRGRISNTLMRIYEFSKNPSYELAHQLAGNKAEAELLLKASEG